MAAQITKKNYIEAMIFSVDNNFNAKELTIDIPENYTEKNYWNALSKKFGLDLSEEKAIGSRRSKACDIFKELKFLRSTFNMTIENEEGEEVHISSLWIKDDHKNIVDELLKVEKETMTGKELAELVSAACTPEQKKNKDFEIWSKGKVQLDKDGDMFNQFRLKEAYPELQPEKIFYPNDNRGRGRKAGEVGKIASYELM